MKKRWVAVCSAAEKEAAVNKEAGGLLLAVCPVKRKMKESKQEERLCEF